MDIIQQKLLLRAKEKSAKIIVTNPIKTEVMRISDLWFQLNGGLELTIYSLNQISKTPEFKYCAVKVEKIEAQKAAEQYIIN